MLPVARKPTLSPSKITTYLACPSKFKWTYVDDRGKWLLRSKSYYSFGTTLHNVLQRFHDAGDLGVTTTHEAIAAMEESWIEGGYASQEEMSQAMADGKEILERYIEEISREPVTSETILVEKMLRLDLDEFVLMGRVDRVDRLADGTLEIVDYKSGRRGVSDADVATDLAMCCYQLLVRHHYPDSKVQASIIALRSGEKGTASLSDFERDEFQRDLIEIGREILHRDYENLEPVGSSLCVTCDFLSLCRKFPEFEIPANETDGTAT